jgi:hypothetical protein
MLFGQKQRFAIEAMIEPGLSSPSRVWGRMRVWCDGRAMGDYSNEQCGMPYIQFKALRASLPKLWMREFDALDDVSIFHRLDNAFFGCRDGIEVLDERTAVQCRDDALLYGRFTFLANWGEMFDGEGKLFILFADGIHLKVLHQPMGSKGCSVLTAPVADAERACDGFLSWFERQASALGAPVVPS